MTGVGFFVVTSSARFTVVRFFLTAASAGGVVGKGHAIESEGVDNPIVSG